MKKFKNVKQTMYLMSAVADLLEKVHDGGIRSVWEYDDTVNAVWYDDTVKKEEESFVDEATGEVYRMIPSYSILNGYGKKSYTDKFKNVSFDVVMCPCQPYIYITINDGKEGIVITAEGDLLICQEDEECGCDCCSCCEEEETQEVKKADPRFSEESDRHDGMLSFRHY